MPLLAAFLLLLSSCGNSPDASDNVIPHEYNLSGFDSIKANSSFTVYASYAETYSVTVNANEDQWDFIDVSVSEGELVIWYDPPEDYNNLQFTVDVTLPDLNRVHLYKRAVAYFYDRSLGTSSRSLWDDSFASSGKTFEILLDGEYSHASFDMVVPTITDGTFYLYSRSDFSSYNRTHTINAKEVVIHSEADNASSTVTLRGSYEPEIMIVQGDRYGTLSMKDFKSKELFIQMDYYKNTAYLNTARFMGEQSDRVKVLREQYGLNSSGSHSRSDSYVSSFSSIYYKYGAGSTANVKVLSSSAVFTTY
nr:MULTISPECIES: DUF2807 domain-containing protein [unclassified Oceanispirochaeta]